MSWLLWRQHRMQALVTAVGLGLFAIAVALTGVHMAHIYKSSLAACTSNGTCNLVGNLFSGYGAIIDLVHLSIALPVVLGAFVGATLVAREREHATNVLVWTQTVTRRRWLYTKIATVLVGTLVASAAVSALVTWWSGTPERARRQPLRRRAVRYAEHSPHRARPVRGRARHRGRVRVAANPSGVGDDRCRLRRRARARLGLPPTALPQAAHPAVPVEFRLLGAVGIVDHEGALRRCRGQEQRRADTGARVLPSDRQGRHAMPGQARLPQHRDLPAPSHYWPFQWIESGIFLGLAAVLLVVAVVYTLRHDA